MSSSSNAELKFYAGDYGLDYYGIMDPYKYEEDGSGTEPADLDEQWDVTRVKINDGLMDDHGLSSKNRREVVIHEVGHALGLVHQPDGTTTSVMEETDMRERTNPGSLDISLAPPRALLKRWHGHSPFPGVSNGKFFCGFHCAHRVFIKYFYQML